MNRKKILLLDGTGLVYRAYFAFLTRPLTTSRGENTSAIFGFFKILFQILRDFKPQSIVVAFDISRKTFRGDIYPEYKAHREETPPDLKTQIPIVIDLLKKMELPILEVENYEADDIIGTLSNQLGKDHDVYIVSSDKDLLQLVGGNVRAVRPQHGISEINLIDSDGVKEAFGVYPDQIPDYLAIVGDTSDNIPGVKGIGEKGAVKLLTDYRNLEDIYEHIDAITGATQKKLIESKDNAFLSKKLAQIHLEVPISGYDVEDNLDLNKLQNPEAVKTLTHYQLQSLVNDMKKLLSNPVEEPKEKDGLFDTQEMVKEEFPELKGKYELILTETALKTLLDAIKKAGLFALVTETTTTTPASAELVGISVSIEEAKAFFIPVKYPAGQDFSAEKVLELFKPILEDEKILKTGQNVKYDWEIFYDRGITMQGISFDTMLAAFLINPARARNNLESLTQEYLGFKKKDYTEVLKPILKKDKTLLDAPIEAVTQYACSDADAILRLYKKLFLIIEKNGLTHILKDIEQPLAPVLGKMELTGVGLDTARLSVLSKELTESVVKLEKEIYYQAGKEFNINSPIQLSKILFEEMGLEPVKKTDGGKASTDEEVLSILSYIHPLPASILKYRTFTKLKNTYIDVLPLLILPKTGRIHTNFNQTIAATGRLSSTDPNLQNIPIRDEIGRKIREAFIAAPGKILLSADYSQIELRILAHFCGDANMRKAFTEGLDIHRHTASLVFEVPEKDVTEEMRRRAKSVNFGIIYGLQAYGLSRQIGISMSEAKIFIQSYFDSFPSVRAFVEGILKSTAETGEVRTLSGRYRKFAELIGKEVKHGAPLNASQRMALNTRIQGSAADIIKIAMINLQKWLDGEKLKSRLILQIHDELVVEAPEEEADLVEKKMIEIMENAYPLEVPLVVDCGRGKNWSEAH